MTDRFPTSVLTPRAIAFWPAVTARLGPRTFGGGQQVVASDAGVWRARLVDIYCVRDKVLAFRAMMARMQGPLNSVLLGPMDCRHTPPARSGTPSMNSEDITWSDDTTFSDGSYWHQGEVLCSTKASALARAESIRVQVEYGYTIEAGQYIGVADRLYIVHSVSISPTDSRDHTLSIWPPLRAAIVGVVTVEIENPVCPMRLVTEDVPELELDLLRYGRVTLEFEEVV